MAEIYTRDRRSLNNMLDRGKEISGLGNRLQDKISTYSKGMTRKLLLSRTVMVNPRLAILDEPTSGLDIINAIEIRRIIRDLAKNGMAVLLSSHNMLEIEFLSEKVAIIDKGIIHDEGTPIELKTKYKAENLEEVFERAVK
jgi:ABC-2 type transport system ATP-binding protein